MNKILKTFAAVSSTLLIFGSSAISAGAITQPQPWDVTGSYNIDFELNGVPPIYTHAVTLTQTNATLTGSGQYPDTGSPTYHWNITSGSVNGTSINLTALYDQGATGTTMTMTGTIDPNRTMHGTWHDDFGGPRDGTWATSTGAAVRFYPEQCDEMIFNKVIIGTDNSETLNGTSGNDLIIGKEGNDKINGLGGNDCIVTGNGNNKVDGGSGNDTIVAGSGNNTLSGGAGKDSIYGGDGNDSLSGGSGQDYLDGQGGTNTIDGGSGNDTCLNGVKSSCEL